MVLLAHNPPFGKPLFRLYGFHGPITNFGGGNEIYAHSNISKHSTNILLIGIQAENASIDTFASITHKTDLKRGSKF